MTDAPSGIPVLVIAGPTASGKTDAALEIAARLGGEIVSADSMQIYRDMEIGTAKPTAEQRGRVPIHLIDFVPPDQEYTVATFQRDARGVIAEIHRRGRLPILCGGTGLYLRAVLEHLEFPPAACDDSIRRELQEQAARLGSESLHARLAEVDPAAARGILPGDARRIIRALEVHRLTGRPMSAVQSVDEAPAVSYNTVRYVLTAPRPVLFHRIERRVDGMMVGGWLEEAAALRERGLSTSDQSMQAIGYRHLLEHLDGQWELAETVSLIKRDTRRFARRQMTWLRRESGFAWLAPAEEVQRRASLAVVTAGAQRLLMGENQR
jgi:tRNA dimethylallyltransferase